MITKLDRLGRSLEHLLELSKLLQERGVDLVVLDQGIDTSTAMGRRFFQILGAIADSSTRSCQSAPWTASMRLGPRTNWRSEAEARTPPGQARAADVRRDRRRRQTEAHRRDLAAEFGVGRPTIYRHLANSIVPTKPSLLSPAS